jgi:regulator of RNase E activity RraA
MIVENIERPSDEEVDALRGISPNDLGHHFHFGFTDAAIEYFGSTKPVTMVGPVVTVRIPPEDSVMVHKSTEVAQEGDVIVVDQQGHTENASWGEMVTRGAMASGASGAVVDGSITDSGDIAELGFPVYARGKSARTTRLHGRGGEINVPVQVGGTAVNPGDVAIGNEDGVLFVPQERIDEAVELCSGIEEREAEMIERLEDGESLADLTDANRLIADMER